MLSVQSRPSGRVRDKPCSLMCWNGFPSAISKLSVFGAFLSLPSRRRDSKCSMMRTGNGPTLGTCLMLSS